MDIKITQGLSKCKGSLQGAKESKRIQLKETKTRMEMEA